MPNALQNPFGLWIVLSALLAALVYAFVRRELRTRALLFGSFLILMGVFFWPPYDQDGKPGKIKLGLDLRGGIHLVMQVMTDDALAAVVDDGVQTAREQLSAKGSPTATFSARTSGA
jgi:preprotein translocase subunit SecD